MYIFVSLTLKINIKHIYNLTEIRLKYKHVLKMAFLALIVLVKKFKNLKV